MLFSLVSRCLLTYSIKLFEAQLVNSFPTVIELLSFVKSRVAVLECIPRDLSSKHINNKKSDRGCHMVLEGSASRSQYTRLPCLRVTTHLRYKKSVNVLKVHIYLHIVESSKACLKRKVIHRHENNVFVFVVYFLVTGRPTVNRRRSTTTVLEIITLYYNRISLTVVPGKIIHPLSVSWTMTSLHHW